jgi:protein ImuB
MWLRRLPTDRLTRSGSHPQADAPLVVVEPVKGALRLYAINDAAARLGLAPGMALADARAMYPRITVADADPAADARMLEAIADWCDRYTPLVGLDPPDGLLLDITGCAHLFGGEEALRLDIVTRLAAQGFRTRAAIASTVGCAWAAARYADSTSVLSNQTRDILLSLPFAALRIDPETTTALAQVGLKRIADVIDRPRAPLAARFGEEFVRRLDQAIGREDEPIKPLLPVPAYVVERRFAEPIAREEDVLGTIEQLANELSRLLERRGEGARVLQVALFRTDGKVHRIAAGAAAPLRDPARMRALFVERLAAIGDECDPGFGYDVIRLAAPSTDRSDPVQVGLAVPDYATELSHLIDRLGARFGTHRVTQFVPQDTHIPEYTVTAVVAVAAPRLVALPKHAEIFQASRAPIRPIRMFERPESVEATAQVPDGPPMQFIWRQVTYHIIHAEGPERIAMEWWRDEEGRKLTRDYFRVESKEGIRAWLYRDGPYIPNPQRSQWYIHGVFA